MNESLTPSQRLREAADTLAAAMKPHLERPITFEILRGHDAGILSLVLVLGSTELCRALAGVGFCEANPGIADELIVQCELLTHSINTGENYDASAMLGALRGPVKA